MPPTAPICRQAAVVLRNLPVRATRIEYSEAGTITVVELRKMLEPDTGPLVRLKFRPSLTVDPNGVSWEAVTANDEIVTGTLVLHAAVSDDEVRTWAEIVIDQRVDPMARRVATEYQRRRHGLERVDGDEDEGQDGQPSWTATPTSEHPHPR